MVKVKAAISCQGIKYTRYPPGRHCWSGIKTGSPSETEGNRIFLSKQGENQGKGVAGCTAYGRGTISRRVATRTAATMRFLQRRHLYPIHMMGVLPPDKMIPGLYILQAIITAADNSAGFPPLGRGWSGFRVGFFAKHL